MFLLFKNNYTTKWRGKDYENPSHMNTGQCLAWNYPLGVSEQHLKSQYLLHIRAVSHLLFMCFANKCEIFLNTGWRCDMLI